MGSIFYVIIMYLLWIVNLFNGTGLGQTYQTTERTRMAVYIILICVVAIKYLNNRNMGVEWKDFYIFGGMSTFFIIDSFLQGHEGKGLDYLWSFVLIYLLSMFPVDDIALKTIGIGYALAGFVVLYVYNFGTTLSGWNPNSIAIMGLNSFLIFTIPFYSLGSIKGKVVIAFVAAIYIWLIYPTDSRSCMIFIAVGTLFALSIVPHSIITSSNKRVVLWLLVPLFVAIITVLISKGSYMDEWNRWSNKQFKKPLFNGRDDFWNWGFELLFEHPLFGNGNLDFANWHNSVVACFTAYGIPGLILWINALYAMLKKGLQALNNTELKDNIIIGSIVTFIIIYIHQSVELGFISSNPSILPYLTIAIMFGRIKQLKKKKEINNVSVTSNSIRGIYAKS